MMMSAKKVTTVAMNLTDTEIENVRETIDILTRFKMMCEKFGTDVINMHTGAVITVDRIPTILGILGEFTSYRFVGEIVDENPF